MRLVVFNVALRTAEALAPGKARDTEETPFTKLLTRIRLYYD